MLNLTLIEAANSWCLDNKDRICTIEIRNDPDFGSRVKIHCYDHKYNVGMIVNKIEDLLTNEAMRAEQIRKAKAILNWGLKKV